DQDGQERRMTYPGGGSGHQQQSGMPQGGMQPQQPQQQGFPPYQQQSPGGSGLPIKISTLVALGVTLLSLVEFFVSFADDAQGTELQLRLLVLGGLLAALHAVPKMPRVLPFAALVSVLGALFYILHVVHARSVDGVEITVLILAILQMLVAVAALLLEYEIVSIPTSGSQQPQYGQYQPQQPAFGGAAPVQQPTQYGPPAAGA